MRQITTASLSNQSLATALLCATYTCDADRSLFVRLFADQVAGNGAYYAYVTVQRLGAGSAYEVQPRTAPTVASGITAIAFTTTAIPVKNTDVVKVYLVGLAGDTTTPDTITEIWEDDYVRPTTADRTLDISSGGEAGLDWANVGSPTTTLSLSGTTVATVTTTTTATNLTNAPTSGDLTATMKTSITTAATAATPSVTVSDKTGFSLSTAGILAIWHQLTSAIVTAGTIGKLLTDNIDAVLSAVKAKTDLIPASPASTTNITAGTITTVTNLTNAPTSGDFTATMKTSITAAVPTAATIATAVWAVLTSAAATVGSLGKLIADNLDAVVSAVKAKTDLIPASPASTTNITGGTITTVTNLTNAPTAGDLTATMKASVTTAATAATPIAASVTGAVGSVTGAVGSVTGNVGGSVASVTAAVTVGAISANVITATSIAADAITAAKIATNAIDADALATDAVSEIVAAMTAPDNTTISNIYSRIGAPVGASISADIATVNTKTTNLPSDPASTSALATAHGSGSWATATGFATPSDVTSARAAILALLPTALVGGKMNSAISALDTDAFSVALLNLIADHVLDRGAALNEASGVTTTKYSLYHLIMQILNGTMAGSTGTAYATDGSTAFTVPLTTDDAALPVTGTH